MATTDPSPTPNATETPEAPKTFVDRVGTILAVSLAALATVFAGMSASSLQRSMFWKAQAAQDQSKATNQWTLAGFKRDRAMMMETSAALLRASCNYAAPNFVRAESDPCDSPHPELVDWLTSKSIPPTNPREKTRPTPQPGVIPLLPKSDNDTDANRLAFKKWLDDPRTTEAIALVWLAGKGPPQASLPRVRNEAINWLTEAIQRRDPERILEALARKVIQDELNAVIDESEEVNHNIDDLWSVLLKSATQLGTEGETDPPTRTARQAALYEMEQRRYRAESRLNQGLGFLYEVRVRVSAALSEKFYNESTLFCYAMMITQVGVVLASLAMARKGNLLWGFAAIIGVAAAALGGYAKLLT